MKVTKYGRCCFVAEPKEGVRIMTDPGSYSTLQSEAKNIDVIIITHEHADHLHIESLQKVLANNPGALIITNTAVGKFLDEASIVHIIVEEGQSFDFKGVQIVGFGNRHADIYEEYGQVQNTGYMIDNLCYPGDSFHYPNEKVDILALPVAGPWMKTSDAIIYAKNINPRVAFPVHDAVLAPLAQAYYKVPEHFLSELQIEFKKLELGIEEEL